MVPYTILQFIDNTIHSAAAVDLVAALPLPPGSAVVLLAHEKMAHNTGRSLSLATQSRAQAALEQRGIRVTSQVLRGDATGQWRIVAEEWRPNLVVLSANGLQPSAKGPWRSVAGPIVEQPRWPVLVVRAPFKRLGRILLAVDGSPASQAAVKLLTGFPLPPEAQVHVLHVVSPEPMAELTIPGWPVGARLIPPGPSLADIAAWDKRQKAERDEKAQALVSETVQTLEAAGLQARGQVAYGSAAEVILRYARTKKVDLTMVGSRGLGAVRGWLLGSVSRRLIKGARRTVLVAR